MKALIFALLLPVSLLAQFGEYTLLTYGTDDYEDLYEGTFTLYPDERGGWIIRGVEYFHQVFPGLYETNRGFLFEILVFLDGVMIKSDEEYYILTGRTCEWY
jgi:hypothetical protein